MADAFEIKMSRSFAVLLANRTPCPWERARCLFNLGIRGGTTRAQVDRMRIAEPKEAR
jgi:hypothetical protein